MNGNIASDGITADLEWMHRVGLGGYQNFDAALQTPQVVEKRLAYMTPEWKDAFKHAIQLGDQLGMEMAIAGSPGWSESGGPWVPGSEGMKKYVWSATPVQGGKPFSGVLAHPPSRTGAFQNMGVRDELGSSAPGPRLPEYYADAAVVAYKRPAVDKPLDATQMKVTSSGGDIDAASLSDGDLEKTVGVPIPAPGELSWLQYEFPQPQTIRSVTFVARDLGRIQARIAGTSAPEKTLEASDDGQTWRQVAKLGGPNSPEHTITFPAATARYFRVTFKRTPPPPVPDWEQGIDPSSLAIKVPPKPTKYEIAELELHAGPRVSHFEAKAAFTPVPDLYGFATPHVDGNEAIAKSDVIDLTSKMTPDGKLNWTPPEGDWVVLRFGYSLLEITNHPATAEATGRQDGSALCEELL
jgi:hypothetical protein